MLLGIILSIHLQWLDPKLLFGVYIEREDLAKPLSPGRLERHSVWKGEQEHGTQPRVTRE